MKNDIYKNIRLSGNSMIEFEKFKNTDEYKKILIKMNNNWIKIKSRWNNDESQKLKDLGLEIESKNKWEYREIWINKSKIAFIESYEDYCYIAFSAINEDGLITDVPYSQKEIFMT